MPMTARQLAAATADYDPFIDGDEIVAVETAQPSRKSTCDICGDPFEAEYVWKDIDGNTCCSYSMRAAKQLVILPNTLAGWRQGSVAPRHYRLLVCRQGVSCRKRRLEQLAVERAPRESFVEPHVVAYAAA